MFAVIKAGGKQYRVAPDDIIEVEKISGEPGDIIELGQVLMLSGGLCALMLQTLHPRALAGVWDHSNFREDLVGRLRRTTAFVAGTTYAGRSEADRLIARVAAIHARVRGTLPDGRAYAADDPQLLTWVHATESYGFLQGYRRYCRDALPAGAADKPVAMAAGRDDTLPMLTGIRVEIEGETITLASTDRYRLAVRELTWKPENPELSAVALVPAKTGHPGIKCVEGAVQRLDLAYPAAQLPVLDALVEQVEAFVLDHLAGGIHVGIEHLDACVVPGSCAVDHRIRLSGQA
jgi:hypothetical protein